MNLNPLFPLQVELDKYIEKEKGLEGQDLLDKKKVALLTELYECVNEARFFKFWSKDQKARTKVYSSDYLVLPDGREVEKVRNPLLEEYVDTIHFTLSIGIELGYTEHEYTGTEEMDLNGLVLGLTNIITVISRNMTSTKAFMSIFFDHVIKLGYQLGFSEKQVIEAYHEKNKVNIERQNTGY